MKKLFTITILLLLASIYNAFTQGFQPPAKGKAVVYFTRVNFMITSESEAFEFFHQDKYIGVFKGIQYIRYECDPGEQLFWASFNNYEFITADLEAGKTYIVMVDMIQGFTKIRIGLTPISTNNTKDFEKAKVLINKYAPTVTSGDKIANMNKKLEKFIVEKLEMYESTWKNRKNFKHLSSDMAIPDNKL